MIGSLAKFLGLRGVDFHTFATVFDIGSRDARQALELANLFPEAEVVAIECNPATLEACRRNVARHPRLRLVDKAINSYTGRSLFYPTDPARTVTSWADGNPGASSLFVANGDYPIESYVQNTIEVECVRLDELCEGLGIDTIDFVWMDLQGAELLALELAGALLDKIRYIYTEVSHRPIYHGQCLFTDVEDFLTSRGFRRCTQIDPARWQQDAIYENTRELIDVMIPFEPRDEETLGLCVRSVRSYVQDVRHVYVVGARDPGVAGARFVDERKFPFEASRSYLQQLIRLHFPAMNRGCLEHVLAVEPFTLFLQPCRFIQDRRVIVNFGDEYHPAYFEHMARLHPKLHRMFAYSGIADCMLLKRSWLDELHREVEAQHAGRPFWRAYLEAVDPADGDRGASDYEVYFNFCLMFHVGDVILRQFRWSHSVAADKIGRDRQDYLSLRHATREAPIDQERLERLILGKSV